MNDPLLSVRDLRAGFAVGRRVLRAVDGVSFDVAAGETLALLGESGCGKSAAALSLLRLLPAAGRILDGEVRFAGRDLLTLPEAGMRAVRGGDMAMIFQEPATSLNPVLTVGRQIGEVIEKHKGLKGRAIADRALELLRAVGIADPERRLSDYPFQLSGGMKQRVMVAMALAGDPRLLIADEPTTALDVTIQAQILELLRGLQDERGMGMLLITHDLGVVARMAHRVGVMYAGEIVEEAPREAFFDAPRHPYTQKLFAALPDRAGRGARLETIAGQVPPLAAMPAGCRFAARCSFAWTRCRVESPAWTSLGSGHRARCHRLGEGRDDPAIDGRVSPPAENPSPIFIPAGEFSVSPQSVTKNLLEVDDLRVHFPIRHGVLRRVVGHVRAVDGVSLELERGRTLALVGESGCGKTTVGKAILQLIRPTGGRVRLDGRALDGLPRGVLRPLRRRMQMIFQDPFASLDPRLSIGEIVAEGMEAFGVRSTATDRAEAVAALLRQVGLDPEAAQRYPHEFSGGQRQRIAIARALAVQPELVICDEPTSALDVSVQAQILNLLKSLQDALGLAYLFITHNFAVVEYLAHEVAVMYLGRIVERGPVDAVLRQPGHPYTQALLSAILSPRPTTDHRALIRLSGEMPSPARSPSGCHFHPRCPRAAAACRVDYPEARPVGPAHVASCHFIDRRAVT
ncbi:MAG: dipeptide ABC transporter ATP-binding protein [Candidatus Accumulibacter sp.]|jgi:peptide/nickel transport system ATP-binding protein|nr:dipeptide ABC transporter ATP-binding protein [Accumulibacter sp.]